MMPMTAQIEDAATHMKDTINYSAYASHRDSTKAHTEDAIAHIEDAMPHIAPDDCAQRLQHLTWRT